MWVQNGFIPIFFTNALNCLLKNYQQIHVILDHYNIQIKCDLPEEEKEKLQNEYDLHLSEAQNRYEEKTKDTTMAKENLQHKVLTADLQKCLPTPALTNDISFYKRKLWSFNFTIHDAADDSSHCIMWDESKGGRGGNEIGSAIIKWADSVIPNSSVDEITIWTDNCLGQNKNAFVISSFFWLLHRYPQIKQINHKFLLEGHTHMEADSIHAPIERKRKA